MGESKAVMKIVAITLACVIGVAVITGIIVLAVYVADNRENIPANSDSITSLNARVKSGPLKHINTLDGDLKALKALVMQTKKDLISKLANTQSQLEATLSSNKVHLENEFKLSKSSAEGLIQTARSDIEGKINTQVVNVITSDLKKAHSNIASQLSQFKDAVKLKMVTGDNSLKSGIKTAKSDVEKDLKGKDAALTTLIETEKATLEGKIITEKSGVESQMISAKSALEGKITTGDETLWNSLGQTKTELEGKIKLAKSNVETMIKDGDGGLVTLIDGAKTKLEGIIKSHKDEIEKKIVDDDSTLEDELKGSLTTIGNEIKEKIYTGTYETMRPSITKSATDMEFDLNKKLQKHSDDIIATLDTRVSIDGDLSDLGVQIAALIQDEVDEVKGSAQAAVDAINVAGYVDSAITSLASAVKIVEDSLPGFIGSTLSTDFVQQTEYDDFSTRYTHLDSWNDHRMNTLLEEGYDRRVLFVGNYYLSGGESPAKTKGTEIECVNACITGAFEFANYWSDSTTCQCFKTKSGAEITYQKGTTSYLYFLGSFG